MFSIAFRIIKANILLTFMVSTVSFFLGYASPYFYEITKMIVYGFAMISQFFSQSTFNLLSLLIQFKLSLYIIKLMDHYSK